MFIPFQPTSMRRRWGRSLRLATTLMIAFGLAGVYVNLPPLGPPGANPSRPSALKKCPECGSPVHSEPDEHCICVNCGKEFEAAGAEDYS